MTRTRWRYFLFILKLFSRKSKIQPWQPQVYTQNVSTQNSNFYIMPSTLFSCFLTLRVLQNTPALLSSGILREFFSNVFLANKPGRAQANFHRLSFVCLLWLTFYFSQNVRSTCCVLASALDIWGTSLSHTGILSCIMRAFYYFPKGLLPTLGPGNIMF